MASAWLEAGRGATRKNRAFLEARESKLIPGVPSCQEVQIEHF